MPDITREFSLGLTPETWCAVRAHAEIGGLTADSVIAGVINAWGDEQMRFAVTLDQVIAEHVSSTTSGRPLRGEKAIETTLADALLAAGLAVKTQLTTPNGIADIVVYDSGPNPLAVIEVKASAKTPGEINQACGQAKGYAESICARIAITCVPEARVGHRFGVIVLPPGDVVGFLLARVHDAERAA